MSARKIYCCGCQKKVAAHYRNNKWNCADCGSSVECYMGSMNPIGYLQTPEMINARKHIHEMIRRLANHCGSSTNFIVSCLAHGLGLKTFTTARIKTIEDARDIYRLLLKYEKVVLSV